MQNIVLNVGRKRVMRNIQNLFFSSQPEQMLKNEICKVVNVAIIGAPNSGKSTLINNITGRKICAASNKVHTTTKLARAMCYADDVQIIFLDTPGIVTEKEQKRYSLPTSMIKACEKSLRCANVIGVVHDVANQWTKDKLHKDVLRMLEMADSIPSFLIMNKVDVLKSKHQLLSLIYNLTNGTISGKPIPGPRRKEQKSEKDRIGYSHFSDVFLVSALKGDGVLDIKKYLIRNAQPASSQYSNTLWTDQEPKVLIEEAVRAKFLNYLNQEIPYTLSTSLEYLEDNKEDDKIICSVNVECPSERLLKLIAGAGGGRLHQIKTDVRMDLIQMFQKTVQIDICLKVKRAKKE